jgi:hypothetical protein
MFVNDTVERTDTERTHARVTGVLNILGILCSDDHAIASHKNHGPQKTYDVVDYYCRSWNSRCNLNKTKIIVLRGGGGIKGNRGMKNERREHRSTRENYLSKSFF